MMIRKAGKKEYEKVINFYYQLIDDMQGMEYHPKWQKGVYPDPKEVELAIQNDEMYIYEQDGIVISAMRVNHAATEGYEKVKWKVDASENEVYIIHMLGVALYHQGCGVAKQMVKFVIEKAREEGQKAIRLDVLCGNIPANRLYEAMGFEFIEKITLFYEDTGITDFELYELVL